jgi:hypothetical protein
MGAFKKLILLFLTLIFLMSFWTISFLYLQSKVIQTKTMYITGVSHRKINGIFIDFKFINVYSYQDSIRFNDHHNIPINKTVEFKYRIFSPYESITHLEYIGFKLIEWRIIK